MSPARTMPSAADRARAKAILETVAAIRQRNGKVPSANVQVRAAALMGAPNTEHKIGHQCGFARLVWIQGSERRYPVTLMLERAELDSDVIDAVCPCDAGASGQTCYHVLAALASVRVQDGAKLKT